MGSRKLLSPRTSPTKQTASFIPTHNFPFLQRWHSRSRSGSSRQPWPSRRGPPRRPIDGGGTLGGRASSRRADDLHSGGGSCGGRLAPPQPSTALTTVAAATRTLPSRGIAAGPNRSRGGTRPWWGRSEMRRCQMKRKVKVFLCVYDNLFICLIKYFFLKVF